jgi:hypothetical protein
MLRRSSGDDVRPTRLVGDRGPLMHATSLSRNPGFLMSTPSFKKSRFLKQLSKNPRVHAVSVRVKKRKNQVSH